MREDLTVISYRSMPVLLLCGLALATAIGVHAQQDTQSHLRVERKEVAGHRVSLTSLKGAQLYIPSRVDRRKPAPLIIHFHGAPWLIEQHTHDHMPNAALITVQLGAGSRVYGVPFERRELLDEMLAEASRVGEFSGGFSSITLMAFSAGYGAARSILRHPEHFRRVDALLLLDGFHAGYDPEGVPLHKGGVVAAKDIDSFVAFARGAASGRKTFVITHSQIHPGTYASTSECSSRLLAELNIPRTLRSAEGPAGMRQLSTAVKKNLRVFGYAGDTAPDHVDHLHAAAYWFRFLDVR